MAPDPQVTAAASVEREIGAALEWLSVWCPHGMDSSRVGDYNTADRVRELLNEARDHMRAANRRW